MAVVATKRKPKTHKEPVVITVPVQNRNGDEVHVASNLQKALSGKNIAQLVVFGVPDERDDTYCKRIRCTKRAKKAGEDVGDIPDMEDTWPTNLPWCGYATFRQASRQFRSRNVLGVTIETVREIDGYLWSLSIAAESMLDEETVAPALITLMPITRMSSQHTMIVNRNFSSEEHETHLSNAPSVPQSLAKEFYSLGYQLRYHNSVPIFYHPEWDNTLHWIRVDLYGKMIRPSKD